MSEQNDVPGRNRIPAVEDCDRCGAAKGDPCIGPRGTPIKGVHVTARPTPDPEPTP